MDRQARRAIWLFKYDPDQVYLTHYFFPSVCVDAYSGMVAQNLFCFKQIPISMSKRNLKFVDIFFQTS